MKETPSPTRFQGGGGTFHGDAGGRGSHGVVSAERGAPVTSQAPLDPLPRKREGVTGKTKPGKHCSENKAGLSKADTDTDTQAQEQERKRRHSDPQQEKAKFNLGRDHDKVQRQQTQAYASGWGKCT